MRPEPGGFGPQSGLRHLWPLSHLVHSRQTDPKFHCEGAIRLAIDDKYEQDIQKLIDAGKEKGYLTYN